MSHRGRSKTRDCHEEAPVLQGFYFEDEEEMYRASSHHGYESDPEDNQSTSVLTNTSEITNEIQELSDHEEVCEMMDVEEDQSEIDRTCHEKRNRSDQKNDGVSNIVKKGSARLTSPKGIRRSKRTNSSTPITKSTVVKLLRSSTQASGRVTYLGATKTPDNSTKLSTKRPVTTDQDYHETAMPPQKILPVHQNKSKVADELQEPIDLNESFPIKTFDELRQEIHMALQEQRPSFGNELIDISSESDHEDPNDANPPKRPRRLKTLSRVKTATVVSKPKLNLNQTLKPAAKLQKKDIVPTSAKQPHKFTKKSKAGNEKDWKNYHERNKIEAKKKARLEQESTASGYTQSQPKDGYSSSPESADSSHSSASLAGSIGSNSSTKSTPNKTTISQNYEQISQARVSTPENTDRPSISVTMNHKGGIDIIRNGSPNPNAEILQNMLLSKTRTDMTLNCIGESIKCHKAAIIPCSSHLSNIFNQYPDSQQIEYDLGDVVQPTVRQFIRYCYYGVINSVTKEGLHALSILGKKLYIKEFYNLKDQLKNSSLVYAQKEQQKQQVSAARTVVTSQIGVTRKQGETERESITNETVDCSKESDASPVVIQEMEANDIGNHQKLVLVSYVGNENSAESE